MLCSAFSELITDTLQGLGYPDKSLLEVEDCARAVVHSIALVKQFAGFSNQNLDIHTYEWEASDRDEQLLALDLALPLWVERRLGSDSSSGDYWKFVPTCNLAVLEDAKLRGEYRCAFYTEDGVPHIRFSYLPTDLAYQTHRIRYDGSVMLADTFNDLVLDTSGTGISSNFFPLVTARAELEVIPTMLIKLAETGEHQELIRAYENRQAYLVSKVGEWSDRFNHFVFGQRGRARGRRRRKILVGGYL